MEINSDVILCNYIIVNFVFKFGAFMCTYLKLLFTSDNANIDLLKSYLANCSEVGLCALLLIKIKREGLI